MNYLRLALLISIIAIVGCSEPKSSPTKQWFKGNLHTHSYWSDGDEFPEAIMDWYKNNYYHFVALTDHNILAEGEKWKTISNDSIYQTAFKKYLNTYGSDWVERKQDSLNRTQVKLKTYEEYRPKFEKEGEFLIIQSEEITDGYNGKAVHIANTSHSAGSCGGRELSPSIAAESTRPRRKWRSASYPRAVLSACFPKAASIRLTTCCCPVGRALC